MKNYKSLRCERIPTYGHMQGMYEGYIHEIHNNEGINHTYTRFGIALFNGMACYVARLPDIESIKKVNNEIAGKYGLVIRWEE